MTKVFNKYAVSLKGKVVAYGSNLRSLQEYFSIFGNQITIQEINEEPVPEKKGEKKKWRKH